MKRSREQFTHRLTAMTGRYFFCSRASWLVFLVVCLLPRGAQAQLFRRAGHEFSFIRPIDLAATGGATIGVVEFYHHGQIDQQGKNVIVALGNEVLPVRILQIGPGDFCRLAFQITAARATGGRGPFEILYGGDPFPEESRPKWSAEEGLLLEVREYKECNLNSFQSVKAAFESARPYWSRLRANGFPRRESIRLSPWSLHESLQRRHADSQNRHVRVLHVESGLQLSAHRWKNCHRSTRSPPAGTASASRPCDEMCN
ncbi:MAG: hypothetical protein KatS3mg112_1536 [Thermogutta sp.]|nr:MAG: hypothetical protein KatS3mg112_1536 [Thermogutta sp.]